MFARVFSPSTEKSEKQLTVDLEINHEGLLGEGLEGADIFTSVPDDDTWTNQRPEEILTNQKQELTWPARSR